MSYKQNPMATSEIRWLQAKSNGLQAKSDGLQAKSDSHKQKQMDNKRPDIDLLIERGRAGSVLPVCFC